MKITKRDLLVIAPVVVVLAVLIIASTGRRETKTVPADGKHRPFYEAMEQGADRVKVERDCITCHNPQANPLPRKHPPKEQCLICHRLHRAKQ
jgi:hypothetical protein